MKFALIFPPEENKTYYVAWYHKYYYAGNYYIKGNTLPNEIRCTGDNTGYSFWDFYNNYLKDILDNNLFDKGDKVLNNKYEINEDFTSSRNPIYCVITNKENNEYIHKYFVIQSELYDTNKYTAYTDENDFVEIYLNLIKSHITMLYAPGKQIGSHILNENNILVRANYAPTPAGVPYENAIYGYILYTVNVPLLENSSYSYVNNPPYRMISMDTEDAEENREYLELLTAHLRRNADYASMQHETASFNPTGINGYTVRLKFTKSLENETRDYPHAILRLCEGGYSGDQLETAFESQMSDFSGLLFINSTTRELIFVNTNWRNPQAFKYKLPGNFDMYSFHTYSLLAENTVYGANKIYLDNELVIESIDGYASNVYMGRMFERELPVSHKMKPFVLDYIYAFTKGYEPLSFSTAYSWEPPKHTPEYYKNNRDKKIRERIKLNIDRYYAMRLEAHLFNYGIDTDKITKIVYVPFADPKEVIKFAKETRDKQCGFFCEIGKDNLRFEEEMGNLEWVVKALKLDPRIEYTVDSLTEYLEEFDNDPKYPVKDGVYLIVDEDKTIFDSLIEVFKPSNKHVGLFIMLELKPGDHI